jgi:hypothetical protein
MSTEHDKQDELQKMLALKRHETPSPRFFKGFSGQVIDRLHTPELPVEQAWWQRLGLDSKPVLVCASGVVVCGLLVIGLVASLRVPPPKPVPRAPDDKTHLVVAPAPAAGAAPASQDNPLTSPGADEAPQIGEPITVVPPSAFGTIKLQPKPATPGSAPVNSDSREKP